MAAFVRFTSTVGEVVVVNADNIDTARDHSEGICEIKFAGGSRLHAIGSIDQLFPVAGSMKIVPDAEFRKQ